MVTPIHAELQSLSGKNPAGYLLVEPLARLAINRLLTTIAMLKGKALPAGSGRLGAALNDVVWSTKPEATLSPPVSPTFPDREVDILISSSFEVSVNIFVASDPTAIISEVRLKISDARSRLRAENNILVIEGAYFDAKRNIQRTSDADKILTSAGIDPLEAAHMEGHIGYGVISQSVAAALGQRQEIPLSSVFPVVDFGRSIKLSILQGGYALGIIPTDLVTISEKAHCGCNEGSDLGVSHTTITNSAPPNAGVNDQIASVNIGGPVPDNLDPLKDFGKRPRRDGVAGLYIPTEFAEKLTVKAMPSIKIRASDNGTIGFRAEANVGFENFKVSFDVVGGGILLDIGLDISVNAYCDFELFKGVRVPIGWAVISPASGSSARVQMGFYPAVDSSGVVSLKSTLKTADMGSYVAVVIGIGTALKIIGVTAWIGFLIDVVLSAILSTGLPIALKKEISKYLADKEWKIIDGLTIADPKEMFWSAPFDVQADSLLASVDYRG